MRDVWSPLSLAFMVCGADAAPQNMLGVLTVRLANEDKVKCLQVPRLPSLLLFRPLGGEHCSYPY